MRSGKLPPEVFTRTVDQVLMLRVEFTDEASQLFLGVICLASAHRFPDFYTTANLRADKQKSSGACPAVLTTP